MELTCPECRGLLRRSYQGWAECALHGGQFEVLFDRDLELAPAPAAAPALPPPPPGAPAGEPFPGEAPAAAPAVLACAAHPQQAAVASCASCAKPLCSLCSFDLKGRTFCADCAGDPVKVAAVEAELFRRRRSVSDGPCVNHPGSPAVALCQLCTRAVCATCDFVLPGGIHVCPQCVENQSSQDVSPKRKKMSYISLALAAWSTILFTLLLAGVFNSLFTGGKEGEGADAAITSCIFWPLVIGTGLALGALDRKLKNTGLMRAALWWNGILGGIFLLLILAANLGLIGK